MVEQVFPVESNAPAGFTANLRPYQRQSLAFMVERERGTERAGGWLCDEMGMGKRGGGGGGGAGGP